jgi:small-conductance mechanosensitive channel/CRP-like cAMP-binding protein
MIRSLALTAAVFAFLLLTAWLVGRFAPTRRNQIRRGVFLFAFQAIVTLGELLVATLGATGWAENAQFLAQLLAVLTLLHLAGVVLFYLVLPKLGMTVTEIVADITMGAAYFLALLSMLRTVGLNLSGILATSAVVTAVLGLSLQATLGNILGGLALQLDNSIRVGDWIQLEDGRQGRVAEIHWRHTLVETRDWDSIVVPNSTLLGQTITILGKRGSAPLQHRMWVHFNVDFRFSPVEVVRVVDEALQAAPIPDVAQAPAPHAICFDFSRQGNESVAHYAVRYWLTDLARDDPTSSLIRLRIFSALQRADIPLAVPASTVFVTHLDDERVERKARRSVDRRMAALDMVEIFAPMTEEEKRSLAPRIRHAIFAPGETITRQGQEAHWFYVLTRGTCDVRRADGGKDHLLTTFTAPQFFGEMGLMTGARRDATVIAKTEVECFRIDKEDFHSILRDRPEIAEEISRILAEREVSAGEGEKILAAGERERQADLTQSRILTNIRSFFGLGGSRVA